ncbi:MAG: class I SAM-dependent methyltransferase [Flavobacteriaceae bacterium]|jgi:tRNA (cmo5U34)-methyltransferase|nr:class I SAM-dependent methyltransferase [Flavobacteriaceae bacterium]
MESVKSKFNSVALHYDKQRTRLIPCFTDFYQMTIENLVFTTPSPEILDLGAGTGLLSDFVIRKYPDARLTLVDLSEKMLEISKERFSHNPNVTIVCQDFTTYTDDRYYDAIISSLAIHHLEDSDKNRLYSNIYSALKKDGLFINAEQVSGHDEYFIRLYEKQWKNKVENSDLTQQEIDAAYERVKLDKRTPLSVQLKWLKEAGFKEVDCLYKYYDFAVIYCKK